MTTHRMVACSRIPVGTCVAIVAIVLSLVVGATPAYAATHIPTTTYNSNTTWTTANSPYVLDGDVTVASGVTLTVESGVVVKFNGQFRTMSVNGTLQTLGTDTSPITFTSYQDDSVAGDTNGDGAATNGAAGQWYHIAFDSGSSQLLYVNVRYGGFGAGQTGAPIYIHGSGHAVSLDHVTLMSNLGAAVMVGDHGTATITNSSLSNNAYGLFVDLLPQRLITQRLRITAHAASGSACRPLRRCPSQAV